MKTLKVNDKVRVISGGHKGEEATIVRIDRQAGKAMLEGIGTRERHLKKTQYNPMGGKKNIHLGIDLSNLKLVEEKTTVKKSAVKKETETKTEAKDAKVKKGAK